MAAETWKGIQAPLPKQRTPPSASPQEALVPAVLIELTVDNSESKRARELVFGYSGGDPYSNMRHFSAAGLGGARLVGVGQGGTTAILTSAPGARTSMGAAPCLYASLHPKQHTADEGSSAPFTPQRSLPPPLPAADPA